eukprot:scaffold118284_cov87-Phaeocystis_antarctica.AAC.3
MFEGGAEVGITNVLHVNAEHEGFQTSPLTLPSATHSHACRCSASATPRCQATSPASSTTPPSPAPPSSRSRTCRARARHKPPPRRRRAPRRRPLAASRCALGSPSPARERPRGPVPRRALRSSSRPHARQPHNALTRYTPHTLGGLRTICVSRLDA